VSALVAGTGLLTLTPAPTAVAATPVVTMAGQLPGGSVAAGATVVVVVESPLGTLDNPVPDTLTWTPVAVGTADSNGSYSVPVPDGSAIDAAAAADNGHVNFFVAGITNDQATVAGVPANLSDASSSEPLGGTVTSDASDFAGFTPMTAAEQASWQQQYSAYEAAQAAQANGGVQAAVTPSDNLLPCDWEKVSSTEQNTRIGELHVADVAGSSGTWHYAVAADNEFSAGFSMDATNWTASGTVTASNSIGADSGFTRGRGYYMYVNGNDYYGKYHNKNGLSGICHDLYMTHVTSSVGDSYDGLNHPSTSPWGSCRNDPYGYAVIPPGGFYQKDFSKAVHYNGVATVWKFTVSGRTGYTKNIDIGLHNSSSTATTYACGKGQMPNVPVIYNTP
jgi:hypothetical protein